MSIGSYCYSLKVVIDELIKAGVIANERSDLMVCNRRSGFTATGVRVKLKSAADPLVETWELSIQTDPLVCREYFVEMCLLKNGKPILMILRKTCENVYNLSNPSNRLLFLQDDIFVVVVVSASKKPNHASCFTSGGYIEWRIVDSFLSLDHKSIFTRTNRSSFLFLDCMVMERPFGCFHSLSSHMGGSTN